MTAAEQTEFKVVLRWLKVGAILAVGAIFSAGMLWATSKARLDQVPVLVEAVLDLKRDQAADRQVMRDFMLLACARHANLNETEQAVCNRYQPREAAP